MTKQIVIKLNRKKFEPIMNKIWRETFHGIPNSDSECVGRSLHLLNCMCNIPKKELNNKTMKKLVIEKLGINEEKFLMRCMKDYSEFLKSN